MAWTSVSPHGISAAEGLDDVPAMSASGNTLFAAGYDTGSERAAELWALRSVMSIGGWFTAFLECDVPKAWRCMEARGKAHFLRWWNRAR
jgi:hypothetical protein